MLPIRVCTIVSHEESRIDYLCVYQDCKDYQRFLCIQCIKQESHKHNQENQNHIYSISECYKIVLKMQNQFKEGDTRIYTTFLNIFKFLSKQFSLHQNNVTLLYHINSANQILLLDQIQLDQFTKLILINRDGYENELKYILNELNQLYDYHKRQKSDEIQLRQNQAINYNNGDWVNYEIIYQQKYEMNHKTERQLMIYKTIQFLQQKSYYEALQITNIALETTECFLFYFLKGNNFEQQGMVLRQINQFDDAIKCLDLSIKINPYFQDSQLLRGTYGWQSKLNQTKQKIQAEVLALNIKHINSEIQQLSKVKYQQSTFSYQVSRYQACYCRDVLFIVFTKNDDLIINRQQRIQFADLSANQEIKQNEVVQQMDYKHIVRGSQVSCMKFTMDNNYMQIGLSDGHLFQLQIQKYYLSTKAKIKIHEEEILNIVNITNTLIITSSTDCSIIVTDLVTQSQLTKICAHQAPIYGLYYEQQKIISGSNDMSIKIFSSDGRSIISKDYAHQNSIFQVQANLQTNKIYSCCSVKTQVWKIDYFLYELILEQTIREDYQLFNFSLLLVKEIMVIIYEQHVIIYSLEGQKIQQINHSVQDLGILHFYQKFRLI